MAVTLAVLPQANAALAHLDQVEPGLADRIDEALDGLEANPGDVRFRRRQLRVPPSPVPLWAFTVRGRDEDYLVLWHYEDEESVVVYRIMPDF